MLIAGKINTKLTLGELLYLGFSLGALCVCIINPINNYLFYLYLSILVYVYIFALTVRYRNFSLYQIFLISYFAFLEARIFLNAFGSFDVRTLDAFGNNIMSNEVASETLRTIIVFLIGTSYAWLLLPKNEENRYYEKTLQINGMINSVLKALYYIYFIIFLLKMYFIINLVRTRGYLSVFNGTLSDYDLPIIFWGSGTIIELLFLILIYYNRDELSFRRYSILFLIIGVIRLFTGQRGITFLIFFFVLYLYSTYYKEVKIISWKILILIFLVPIVVELFAQYRAGFSISAESLIENNLFFLLLKNMGISITVIANVIQFRGSFSNKVPFLLGYFVDAFNPMIGQHTRYNIQYGNYLGDYLTYKLSPTAYLTGRSTGTSLVAEVYDFCEGNQVCIFLIAFIITIIILSICQKSYLSEGYFVLSYFLARDFIYSPRWSIFKSIKPILIAFVVTFVIHLANGVLTRKNRT